MSTPRWADRIIQHGDMVNHPEGLQELEGFINSFKPAMTADNQHVLRAEFSAAYHSDHVTLAQTIMLIERALNDLHLAGETGWAVQDDKSRLSVKRTTAAPQGGQIDGKLDITFDVTPNVHAKMGELMKVVKQEVAMQQQSKSAVVAP